MFSNHLIDTFNTLNCVKCIYYSIGADLIDWLAKHVELDGRRAAEELAQRLVDLGTIEHVAGKSHLLKDPTSLYRIKVTHLAP